MERNVRVSQNARAGLGRPSAVGRLGATGFRAALGRLGALSDTVRVPVRWWHWVVRLDDVGRVALPLLAQAVADTDGVVRVSSRGDAVVLSRDGAGALTVLDGRGRLLLPGWLRARVDAGRALYLAARRPDAAAVLVAPVASLDVVADGVAGEVG